MPEWPPYRIAFDTARDPYTARNALGIVNTGADLITSVSSPLAVTGGDLSIDLSSTAASADFPAGAWAAWSPAITSSIGAFGTAPTVTRARYIRLGNTVIAFIDITINVVGTAGGELRFSLPVTASASGGGAVHGRETVLGGYVVGGNINPSDTYARIVAYNGVTVIGATSRCVVNAIYEVD